MRIEDRGSKIEDRGLMIEDRVIYSILDPQSSILDPRSSSIGFTAHGRGDRLRQMRGSVFGHAVTRRLRGVYDELIGRFGRKSGRRLGCWHRRLRLLFFEFDQPPADEEAVEDNTDSDQKWEYSDQPQIANDLRSVRIRIFVCHNIEEEAQEDHHADADEAGDDAALGLIDPSLFMRDADPQLSHGVRMSYFSPPGFAPIGLSFGGVGCHRFAHASQIRATLPAEFEIIVGLKTASGTEHSDSS